VYWYYSVNMEGKIHKSKITSGSVIFAKNEVNVGKITGGSIVICLGPINVHEKITGGAIVISNTRIETNNVAQACDIIAAPNVEVYGHNYTKAVSVEQALNSSRFEERMELHSDLDVTNINSLKELFRRLL